MLDAMGSTNQGNMAYDQYTQQRPYATDAAQQSRYQFGVAQPYMADPYEQARQNLTQQQQTWKLQQPYLAGKYNWQTQQLTNPYINPSNIYGSQ
jgi:hypothetical protein